MTPRCERCGSPHFVEQTSRGQYLCDGCYPRTRVVGATCTCSVCTPPRVYDASSVEVYFRGARVEGVSAESIEVTAEQPIGEPEPNRAARRLAHRRARRVVAR
jgi:hypothetical protein